VREQSFEARGERGAAHFGHDNVGEDDVDGFAEALRNFEGFRAVFSGENTVARGFEKFAGEFADFAFVLDDENGFAANDGFVDYRDLGCRFELLEGLWQINLEAGAAAGGGVDVDEAAALLDDAVDRGEAEAGTLAGFLGGKERLKDAGFGGRVHALAGVGDGYDHVVSALNRRM